MRPSDLYNWNPYTCKMASLYWDTSGYFSYWQETTWRWSFLRTISTWVVLRWLLHTEISNEECRWFSCLTHWDLVTPYGGRDLGQHWFRQWLVAWRHQAITWTNVDFSLVRFLVIHLRAVSQWVPKLLFCIMSLCITLWKLLPHLLRTDELICSDVLLLVMFYIIWN